MVSSNSVKYKYPQADRCEWASGINNTTFLFQFIMRSATIVLAVSALLAQSAIAAPHAFVAPRQGMSLH